MDALPDLEALSTALARLQAMMDAGEFDAMPQLLDAYDRDVQRLCLTIDVQAHRAQLQQLHDRQVQLIEAMQQRQDHLVEQMRAQRQSGRVVRAYASTGTGG